jgi:cysteinyl-tRNA synthetase
LRYALMAVHYRAPMEYTDESLRQATAAVERISTALIELDAHRGDAADDPSFPALLEDSRAHFAEALDDDLNVSAAVAVVFDLVKELNRRRVAGVLSRADAARAAAFIRDIDRVLAIAEDEEETISAQVSRLLDARENARAKRDWVESDRLRADLLAQHSIAVEDTKDGQRWRRVPREPGRESRG